MTPEQAELVEALFIVAMGGAACASLFFSRLVAIGAVCWFIGFFLLIGAAIAGDIAEPRANALGVFMLGGPVCAVALGERKRRKGRP